MYSKHTQTNTKKGTVKSERKRLIRANDDLIRQIIQKYEQVCVCCKKQSDNLQVGHYVSRRFYALRWDLRNVHYQCPGCNIQHNVNPAPYSDYMRRTYGQYIFKALEDEKKRIKITMSELRNIHQALKERI